MMDMETGEVSEKTLLHERNAVREFYAGLEGPLVVGIEATGAMQWFLELLEELGMEYRVGHPAKIRAQETRKQKHDRRDAGLLLTTGIPQEPLGGQGRDRTDARMRR
jgi:transposase